MTKKLDTATKIDEALEAAMAGEKVEKVLANLSAVERQLFNQLVEELRRTAGSTAMEELWKLDYLRRPPTIQEFIEDPYYLGSILKPSEESKGLFPIWRENLLKDFDLDSRVHNVVLTGSLGSGKSYVSVAIMLYRIAVACMLRQPQQFFGLGKGSRIYYIFLSLTRAVVTETIWGDAQNFMANSPFFKEQCGYDPDKKYAGLTIHLGRGIYMTAGSKGWHIIGRNAMGVCLDEGNWRLESNPDQKAYVLYDEVRTRIKNRFQKVGGYLPAISVLASSARDETAFTERVIGDIEKVNDRSVELVYRVAAYEARRHELKLSPDWFKVAYGLKNMDPRLLTGFYDEAGNPVGEGHEAAPPGAMTKLVPSDYLDAFKRNPRTGLQAVCGVSTGGSHKLFSSTGDLERAVLLGEAMGLKSPANAELIPLSTEDKVELWESLDHTKFVAKRHGLFQPLRDPEAMRFAHLDMATASVAGLAICHAVGNKLVSNNYDVASGALFAEHRLVVEYDFVLGLTAGQARPVSFEKVQNFILWLRERAGFRFGLITADTWQTVMPLQMLESRGFKVAIQSMDRTKGPYYAWRTAFEDGRLRLYRHYRLLQEAEQLQDLPDKIDHPPENQGGSKDLTDAAAGAYYGCVTTIAKSGSLVDNGPPAVYTGRDEQASDQPIVLPPPIPDALRVGRGEV